MLYVHVCVCVYIDIYIHIDMMCDREIVMRQSTYLLKKKKKNLVINLICSKRILRLTYIANNLDVDIEFIRKCWTK